MKPLVSLLVLGLVALMSSAPGVLHAQDQLARVQALVTNAADGSALEDAEYFMPNTGHRGTTDRSGSFVQVLHKGHHHVLVHRMGYVGRTVVFDLHRDTLLSIALEPSPYALREVVVRSGGFDGRPGTSPVNTVVLDRDDLDRDQHSTFSQTLERIPGINSITTGVGIAKPMIRGMQGNRITVNDHGIRQEGQQWGSDHGLEIDPFQVERVEIVRGAASLMYGSDAMGGVINILEPLIRPKGSYEGSVVGLFRGNNDHVGFSAGISARPSDIYFGLRTTWQEYGDYRVPADTFVYNRFILPIEDRRLKNTAGRELHMAAYIGKVLSRGTVRLTVSNYHQQAGLFPGAVGIPRAYLLTGDGDRRNVDIPRQVIGHFRSVVNLRHQVGTEGRIEADAGLQLNSRQEESNPHMHGLGPRPEGVLAHGLDLATGTLNVRLHQPMNAKWKSIMGLNTQVQENRRSGFEFILGDHRSVQGGLFFMAEHTPNERTTIQAGIRGDAAYIDVQPFIQPVYASPNEIIGQVERGPAAQRSMMAPSGAVGISWRPSSSWTLRTNLGRSFRFPSAPELTMNGVHHGTFRHEVGNPTLSPETAWQVDGGAYYHRKAWSLSLSPFFYAFDNLIFLRPTAIFSPLPEAGQLYRYTEAPAIQGGGEMEVRWMAHAHLQLSSSLEYVVNQNLDNGYALPFTPPLLSRNRMDLTLIDGKGSDLSCFMEVVVSAAQEWTDRNELPTPGYTLVNGGITASRTFGRQRLDFLLQVRNIGDVPYLMHLSRYRILHLPEPGRNIMLTLRMSFNGNWRERGS